MTTTGYFDTLAERLRALGMPEHELAATVSELSDHLAETGAAPEDEFGPAVAFAERLVPSAAEPIVVPPPDPEAREWCWSCDTYVDRTLLNRYGDQGWEVERVDRFGRFVSRRSAEGTLRWEYRREVVSRWDRERQAAQLAPEGWEPCGYWTYIAYYKRPKSASTGPAAELDSLSPAPAKRFFYSRKVQILLLIGGLSWLFVIVLVALGGLPTSVWAGMLVGGAAGGGFGWWKSRRDITHEVTHRI